MTCRAVRAMNETLKQNRLSREQVDSRLQSADLKKDVCVSIIHRIDTRSVSLVVGSLFCSIHTYPYIHLYTYRYRHACYVHKNYIYLYMWKREREV